MVYGATLAKSCSRSHGQPPAGSRSRRMISNRRCKARAADSSILLLLALLLEHAHEGEQHAGGGAPDVLSLPRDVVQQHVLVTDASQPRLVVGAVEHVPERHFENSGDL